MEEGEQRMKQERKQHNHIVSACVQLGAFHVIFSSTTSHCPTVSLWVSKKVEERREERKKMNECRQDVPSFLFLEDVDGWWWWWVELKWVELGCVTLRFAATNLVWSCPFHHRNSRKTWKKKGASASPHAIVDDSVISREACRFLPSSHRLSVYHHHKDTDNNSPGLSNQRSSRQDEIVVFFQVFLSPSFPFFPFFLAHLLTLKPSFMREVREKNEWIEWKGGGNEDDGAESPVGYGVTTHLSRIRKHFLPYTIILISICLHSSVSSRTV